MPRAETSVIIHAPIERVFDLNRCVEVHVEAMRTHGEKCRSGAGLLELGDEVTWEASHLGIVQTLTAQISQCERPLHFQDVMVRGIFEKFTHDHFFTPLGDAVRVTDVFDFQSPLGLLGRVADRFFLAAYMKKMLRDKNLFIKEIAESEAWRDFLPGTGPGHPI